MSNNFSCFKRYLYNPIAWVIVGGAILGIVTFFVNGRFIAPLETRLTRAEEKLKEHKETCEKDLEEKADLKGVEYQFESFGMQVKSLTKTIDALAKITANLSTSTTELKVEVKNLKEKIE